MGWQDRDWARWTEDERRRFVGGGAATVVPGAFVAVVVSLVAAVMLGRPAHAPRPAPPPVYGTGVVVQQGGMRTTCTKEVRGSAGWICDSWAVLEPNQNAWPATPLPSGTICSTVVANQATRGWVCANTA